MNSGGKSAPPPHSINSKPLPTRLNSLQRAIENPPPTDEYDVEANALALDEEIFEPRGDSRPPTQVASFVVPPPPPPPPHRQPQSPATARTGLPRRIASPPRVSTVAAAQAGVARVAVKPGVVAPTTRAKRNRDEGDSAGNPIQVLAQEDLLCNPQLRDPLTIAISFMPNPGHFRQCCTFTVEVWEQAIYLEGDLPCPYASARGFPQRAAPITFPVLRSKKLNNHWIPNNNQWTCPKHRKFLGASAESRWQPTVDGRPTLESLVINDSSLKEIPDLFLDEIHIVEDEAKLERVDFQHLPNLTQIGSSVMRQCTSVETFTFKNLPQLTRIGDRFLGGTAKNKIKTITLENLPSLTRIGEAFLGPRTTSLEFFALRNLPKLQSLADWFSSSVLDGSCLKTLILEDLTELTTISLSACFMGGNAFQVLETLTLKDLPKLASLDDDFLAQTRSLTTVELVNLPKLTKVGPSCFKGCCSLEILRFRNLPKLETIGPQFPSCSSSLTLIVVSVSQDCHKAVHDAVDRAVRQFDDSRHLRELDARAASREASNPAPAKEWRWRRHGGVGFV